MATSDRFKIILCILGLFQYTLCAQQAPFNWPEGKTMALSLTWDDGRSSQVVTGTALLNQYGLKATFYVVPSLVEQALPGWQQAVSDGHEIGNHSLNHPCSGNFLWARENALEEYTMDQMQQELKAANDRIKELLSAEPVVFAYPCGQTFVGRDTNTSSYVPLIASAFTSGRTWLNEVPNDPGYCDLAQITGIEMDGKDFEYILELIENSRKAGLWLVLAGHDIGAAGPQTTEVEMLKKLFQYLTTAGEDIWVAPVGEISAYIQSQR